MPILCRQRDCGKKARKIGKQNCGNGNDCTQVQENIRSSILPLRWLFLDVTPGTPEPRESQHGSSAQPMAHTIDTNAYHVYPSAEFRTKQCRRCRNPSLALDSSRRLAERSMHFWEAGSKRWNDSALVGQIILFSLRVLSYTSQMQFFVRTWLCTLHLFDAQGCPPMAAEGLAP